MLTQTSSLVPETASNPISYHETICQPDPALQFDTGSSQPEILSQPEPTLQPESALRPESVLQPEPVSQPEPASCILWLPDQKMAYSSLKPIKLI